MINFCCVLYGTKYPVEYAQNLYNMVKRHLTIQHKFYIFTDNVRLKSIIKGDVIVKQFPLHDMNGWWNKMQLFNPDTGLTGVNLYMDLDVVIMKNIDCFATFTVLDKPDTKTSSVVDTLFVLPITIEFLFDITVLSKPETIDASVVVRLLSLPNTADS